MTRAQNPASRLEVYLRAVEDSIKKIGHEKSKKTEPAAKNMIMMIAS